MDLSDFAGDVGTEDPVTVTGLGTRGGPVDGVRVVRPPVGIDWIQADEMTVCCGAGTSVDEVQAALAEVGQRVIIPGGGTVGGALAVGISGVDRLGHGPIRDSLLQARFVDAAGRIITAGGPTVKNVSGFDLCRLLVGSRGTLGFVAEVILRTRPLPRAAQWYVSETDPYDLLASLYRPVSVLWDGTRTHVLLEGHGADLEIEAERHGLRATDGPPPIPTDQRWSVAPSTIRDLAGAGGEFIAEIGVGRIHSTLRPPSSEIDPTIIDLHRAIKGRFDPSGRLNPGVTVLES